MNEIVDFAEKHRNLSETGWYDPSYMFLISFTVFNWLKNEVVDIVGSFQSLTPGDVKKINKWEGLLNLILGGLPEADREHCMYPSWWNCYGISLE